MSDSGSNSSKDRFAAPTSRRHFFKALAGTWGSALQNAAHTEQYPHLFNGLEYNHNEADGHNSLVLAVLGQTLAWPEGISFAQVAPTSLTAEKTTKNILALAQKISPTHLFWDCATAPKGTLPPCPAIVLNPPTDFVAKAPCLFLFTQDQALNHGDVLGQIVRNQPQGSDLYVGRLEEDLMDDESPTWMRVKLFIDET